MHGSVLSGERWASAYTADRERAPPCVLTLLLKLLPTAQTIYSLDGKAWANLGTSSYCLSCNTGDSSDCQGKATSVPVPVSEKGEKAVEDT